MRCWARYLFLVVVATLAAGQWIAACGQKGDLYLPKPEPAAKQAKPVPAGGDVPEVQTGESLEIEDDIAEANAIGTGDGD